MPISRGEEEVEERRAHHGAPVDPPQLVDHRARARAVRILLVGPLRARAQQHVGRDALRQLGHHRRPPRRRRLLGRAVGVRLNHAELRHPLASDEAVEQAAVGTDGVDEARVLALVLEHLAAAQLEDQLRSRSVEILLGEEDVGPCRQRRAAERAAAGSPSTAGSCAPPSGSIGSLPPAQGTWGVARGSSSQAHGRCCGRASRRRRHHDGGSRGSWCGALSPPAPFGPPSFGYAGSGHTWRRFGRCREERRAAMRRPTAVVWEDPTEPKLRTRSAHRRRRRTPPRLLACCCPERRGSARRLAQALRRESCWRSVAAQPQRWAAAMTRGERRSEPAQAARRSTHACPARERAASGASAELALATTKTTGQRPSEKRELSYVIPRGVTTPRRLQ
eukprot:scaffold48187_cov62-Phaeocystis_antarctica.AAC.3